MNFPKYSQYRPIMVLVDGAGVQAGTTPTDRKDISGMRCSP